MVVPYIDVSHLPSSASFFASVLQPLGWLYTAPDLIPDARSTGTAGSVEFGIDGSPVLQLRQLAPGAGPLPLTDLTIIAPSKGAVVAFHKAGLRANPALYLTAVEDTTSTDSARDTSFFANSEGVYQAMLHDLDGNRIEAVFPDPRPAGGNIKYSGSSVRETQSTQSEVGKILHWNYDVASATPRTSQGSTMSRRHHEAAPPLRRSLTHGSQPMSAAPEPETTASSRQSAANGGMNTTTVVGALLGAAAGAGLLYSAWNSREKTEDPAWAPEQAPVLPRRSTFPNMPMGVNSRVHHLDQKSGIEDLAHREYIYAGTASNSSKGGSRDRNLYSDEWTKPRSIINPWTQDSPPSRASSRRSPPRTRAVDDNYDGRSRHSTRFNGGRTSEVRTRSAGPREREILLLEESEHRSRARSRRGSESRGSESRGSESRGSESRGSETRRGSDDRRGSEVRRGSDTPRSRSQIRDTDRESYASARTHKTSSTSRPPLSRPPPVEYETVVRSRASSRSSGMRTPKASPQEQAHGYYSRPTSYVSARNIPLPMSEFSARHVPLPMSDVSARHVPLPMSGVGSSHANWDDDMDSVVPDDSISCVGSKSSSRRSHRR